MIHTVLGDVQQNVFEGVGVCDAAAVVVGDETFSVSVHGFVHQFCIALMIVARECCASVQIEFGPDRVAGLVAEDAAHPFVFGAKCVGEQVKRLRGRVGHVAQRLQRAGVGPRQMGVHAGEQGRVGHAFDLPRGGGFGKCGIRLSHAPAFGGFVGPLHSQRRIAADAASPVCPSHAPLLPCCGAIR